MALSSWSIFFLSWGSINICFCNFRLSDIVAIHVINPTTYGFTEATNISSPITFTLNLTVTPDTENYLYQVCPPSIPFYHTENRYYTTPTPSVVGGWSRAYFLLSYYYRIKHLPKRRRNIKWSCPSIQLEKMTTFPSNLLNFFNTDREGW